MSNPFNLFGKTILVTGASSGIGQQIAISLSGMGAKVVLTGRSEEKLTITKGLMYEGEHQCIATDLTLAESINQIVDEVTMLDGVVHCAGVLKIVPYKLVSKQQFEEMLKLNYESIFFITQGLLKRKKLNKGASLVFISSINGTQIGVQGFTSYAGTKAAIVGFSKALAVELAPNYRVNCILPGMIKTPMYLEMEKTISKEKVEQDKLTYPMRDYGEPEDVANAAIYLLSNASKWVTGTSLIVDGGFTTR